MKHLWMRWVSQQRKLFKVGPGHRMSMVVGSNSLRPLRFGHLALNYELHHPATRDYKNAVVVKPQIHDCLCCLWLHPEETGILCDSERVAVWCYYKSFLRGRDSFNRFFNVCPSHEIRYRFARPIWDFQTWADNRNHYLAGYLGYPPIFCPSSMRRELHHDYF